MNVTVTLLSPPDKVDGCAGTLTLKGDWPNAQAVTLPLRLAPGERRVTASMRASNVKLWWPALSGGSGQTRYHLSATWTDAESGESTPELRHAIGFRSVALITNGDERSPIGRDDGSGDKTFYLLVNGARVLVRGSNFVPFDQVKLR